MKGPKRSEKLEEYGHAGGHLRDALLNALDFDDESWWQHVEIDFTFERHNGWWGRLSHRNRARWLLGQLWNCRDIVPSANRDNVRDWGEDFENVLTYGQLARALKKQLDEITSAVAA